MLIYLQDLYIFKTSEILAISLVGRTTELLLLIILNFFVKKDDHLVGSVYIQYYNSIGINFDFSKVDFKFE